MPEQPSFPPPQNGPDGPLFNEPPKERRFPVAPVVLAAVAIAVILAVLAVVGRHGKTPPPPTTEQPIAAYASNLAISNVQMSQSESLSGGRSTYLDGHIANHGDKTVTGITIQALFANDAGQAPQIETVPLSIIRTRQPYIDTEALSLAPLAPGAEADFRLIFEGISDSWNQQPPTLHIIQVGTR
ncbi:MAG TPA: DUF2393 family protein [Acidobacteriaceae bacterium]|nr:DUF2393 family protein [Acidobacteriaceae bacterium]